MNLKALIAAAALVTVSSLAAASDFLLTVTPGLSAQEYYNQALNYAAQADIAYPVAFADQPLWNRAIANAEAAAQMEPSSPTYVLTAAMYFARTQWWKPAFEHFAQARAQVTLDDTALDTAALTARKLGYMAFQYGDYTNAKMYYQTSLTYRDNESARLMLARLEGTL